MDRKQLIDECIKKLNSLADASGIVRCIMVYEVYQLLRSLKENIEMYEDAQQKHINQLEAQIEELSIALNGSDVKTIHVDLDPRNVNVEDQIPKIAEALTGRKED